MSGQTPSKDTTLTSKIGNKNEDAQTTGKGAASGASAKKKEEKKEGFELRESGGLFHCVDLSNEASVAAGGDEAEVQAVVDSRNAELENRGAHEGVPDGREDDGSNNAQRLPAGGDVDSTLGAPADGNVSSTRTGG